MTRGSNGTTIKLSVFNFFFFMATHPREATSLLYNIQPEDIINAISQWIKEYCKINSLLTDNGRQYIAKSTKEFLAEQNIQLLNTIPYMP
ncbi:hypothetical protein ENBRE01_2087 [Enteropsectra breve]|nr:hypothetical protein ENBRE01_2087 [Enteropsectra breve]